MNSSFEALGLSRELLKSIEDMGFEEPSPIQALAIPPLLEGKDAVGRAQTGTGKTAAFGLPLLEKVSGKKATQGLVLCPTRELAIQVAEELGKLAARKKGIFILPVYGGQPIERQFRALDRGAQVVVGTPGRLIDHLQRGTLVLDDVAMVVLDEADEMLDMGFLEDIETILERAPEHCQRVLFSATMPSAILKLSTRFLHDPETLTVTNKMLTVPAVEQVYYEVRPYQKTEALCRVLDSQGFRKAVVFCSTKRSVDEVTAHLQARGYQADGLHGNLAQPQRDRVMGRFRTGGIEILVATDVAARGIDVDDVDAVINYDIPHDVESYVHRIGRTGRAGRPGNAFTFVTVRENYKLRDIIRYTKARIVQGKLPTLRDVDNIRTSRLLDEVRATIDDGSLDRYMSMVERFFDEDGKEGTSLDLAAALLKLLMQRDFGSQEWEGEDILEQRPSAHRSQSDRGEARGKKAPARDSMGRMPMTRLRINVGRNRQVAPRDVVGAVAGETGIPGRSIGAIDIHDNFTLVEVPTDLADDIMDVLNRGVFIGGTSIAVRKDAGKKDMGKRDAGKGDRPFRKPGLNASRRPKFKKAGKKTSGHGEGGGFFGLEGQIE